MLSRQLERFECTKIRVQVQSSSSWKHKRKLFLFFLEVFFNSPWALKQCVWLLPVLLTILIIKQQLIFIYCNSLELLEEFTDWETDVFVHFHPPQRFGLNNISLSVALAFVSTEEGGVAEGVVIWQRDQQNMSSLNRDGPWGCLLLWRDLLVPVQPWMALCVTEEPCGEGLGRTTIKETVVDLGRQMGQYIKWVCGDLINWLI